jgi:hypothetical protein
MSPVFQNVAPGELITAENFNLMLNEVNWLVDTVTQLRERIETLEQHLGSPPAKTGKDTKDTKEGKEGKDKSEAKEIAKEIDHKIIKESDVKTSDTKSSDVKTTDIKTSDRKVLKESDHSILTEKLVGDQPITKSAEVYTAPALRSSELAQAAAGDPTGYGVPVTQHFITPDLRPDLATSALDDEPDIPDADSSAVVAALPAQSANTSPGAS